MLWVLITLAACAADVEPVVPPRAPTPTATPAPVAVPAGEEIAVPAGTHAAGSMPGTLGRDPGSEADLIAVDVPAFSIDRLPYPNDPSLPARTGVDRTEAARLCDADGKRLCEELEWE